MVKIFTIAFLILFLSGCGGQPIKFTTDVKETLVPIVYSPAPPDIVRPELPIQQMTDDELKSPGNIVKYYKATVKTLIGYSLELEKALNEYDKINKAYKEQENTLRDKFGSEKINKLSTE